MTRIWIIGASGSGKSTLARQLANKIGASCVDLDELNWRPNWQEAPPAEFLADVERALADTSWVVAGNYSRIQSRFLQDADTIIWLDYSLPIVLGRQLKRIVRRVVFHEPCCNGNQETLRRTLSRDSVLLWLLTTFHRGRRQRWATKRRARLNGTRFLHFRRPFQCSLWLQKQIKSEIR
jgi:adenylate kinase family enzyme